jgi:4-hydroxy-tetrahydrodipicolinate reductase
MDALPIRADRRVRARRIGSRRSRPGCAHSTVCRFQQKIGAGLTREQFQKKVDDGSVRHVGLAESISMIAEALGWKLDRITDEIQPKMATETVAANSSLSIRVTCAASSRMARLPQRTPVITLHMEAYLGAPESFDAVEIADLRR